MKCIEGLGSGGSEDDEEEGEKEGEKGECMCGENEEKVGERKNGACAEGGIGDGTESCVCAADSRDPALKLPIAPSSTRKRYLTANMYVASSS